MSKAAWTKVARADFERIDDNYRKVAPDFAERLGRAALAAARFLAEHPRIGSPLGEHVRKWTITGYHFVLVYRAIDEGVEILRMYNSQENWQRDWLD